LVLANGKKHAQADKPARGFMGNYKPTSDYENESDVPDSLDPNNSDLLRDQLRGETVNHAVPPRLEDEGQPGG
jgi:hypothetical protein